MAREDGIQIGDADLLPDGAEGLMPDEGEFNIDDLRVDFSTEEAGSEARDFSPLPSGKYLVAITAVEIRYSKTQKNFGKPFYAMQLKVQNGPHEKRVLFANVMLFNGALYSLAQLMKALGFNGTLGAGVKPPTPDELMGRQMIVSVQKLIDQYKIDQGEWEGGTAPKPMKNEVKSYFKIPTTSSSVGSAPGANELMP